MFPLIFALHPLEEACAPREAGPETRQQHVVASLDAALADRLLERDRDRCARRVAVLVDVDGNPFEWQTDSPGRGVDDAKVGLMRDPEVDVFHRDPCGFANLV